MSKDKRTVVRVNQAQYYQARQWLEAKGEAYVKTASPTKLAVFANQELGFMIAEQTIGKILRDIGWNRNPGRQPKENKRLDDLEETVTNLKNRVDQLERACFGNK